MLRPEHVALRRDDHALDGVPQLAYVVATPVITQEHLQRVPRQLLGSEAKLPAHAGEETIGQLRDIGQTVTKRRHAEDVNVEAVVKILTEGPGRHFGLEVPIGGGNYPGFYCDWASRAQPDHLAVLQRAEELCLSRKRKLPDLVEEQGAPAGSLEGSLSGDRGTGERAALVTEQLTLDQILGQGRAVDGQEGCLGIEAGAVEVAGNELLAGAAFAQDQHRTRDPAHPGDRFTQRTNGRTGARQRRLDTKPSLQGRQLLPQSLAFQPRLDLMDHPLHGLGLFNETVGAQPDGCDAALVVPGPGI